LTKQILSPLPDLYRKVKKVTLKIVFLPPDKNSLMKLLLISNSTNAGEPFLEYPKLQIKDFLGKEIKRVLFIPYAAVSLSYDSFAEKVRERFSEISLGVDPVHVHKNPAAAVESAEAIVVGGGNTFHLLKLIYDHHLLEPIRKKVESGTPFIGWSAGSNVACPTIRTTNDMPIVQPPDFEALNFVSYQINPHYLDAHPDGHAGETREQRINEFITANPKITVAGLREGCMLRIENNTTTLIGKRTLRIFKSGTEPRELAPGLIEI
jgi:dipeptidase E